MIALAVLLLAVPGAAGTRLAPDPMPQPPPDSAAVVPASDPAPGSSPFSAALVGLGGAVLAAGTVLASRRRTEPDAGPGPGAALGLEPPEDLLVVFVPGHGNGPEVFDELVEDMGLDPDQVRYFDYRLATGDPDVHQAAERASIDDAADALNAYLAGLAGLGRPMYVIGFSKGGSTTAEVLSRWDRGTFGANEWVRGAALLDPPLAEGDHGLLQSLGRLVDLIPDDGGYDPIECSVLGVWGCEDRREHLGEAAGVDTIVVRTPATTLTNFGDLPEGLRVYDAPDDGPSIARLVWTRPWQMPGRIGQAHTSVVRSGAVADCIVAEMHTPGSCDLDRARRRPGADRPRPFPFFGGSLQPPIPRAPWRIPLVDALRSRLAGLTRFRIPLPF